MSQIFDPVLADPVTRDESAMIRVDIGGGRSLPIDALMHHAARAKSKVKDSARGWSMLSQVEVIALAWFADQFLVDVIGAASAAQPEPPVISTL